MAFPILPVAAGVLSIGSSLFGGGSSSQTSSIDPAILRIIMDAVRQDRSSGFVPNVGAFNEGIQVQIDEILSQIPAGVENFNTELASRGVFRSGESTKELYKSVYAPVARAATGAAVQGKIGIEQLRLNSLVQAEQARSNLLSILTGAAPRTTTTKGPSGVSGAFNKLGEFADFGFEFGLLKELGLFDDFVPALT